MKKAFFLALLLGFVIFSATQCAFTRKQPDVVIVKHGKLMIKSPVPNARVFVDFVERGRSDTLIEGIPVGEHTITCIGATGTAAGVFHIRKNEVLKLEARYEEETLVPYVEQGKVEKAEKKEVPRPARKHKVRAAKPKKRAKAVVEAKKEVEKDSAEERRELHLNIIKVFFENAQTPEVFVSHKVNPNVIGRFTEKMARSGTYYLTKQNVPLCDQGPCEQQWSSSFTYTDETGKSDSFGLTWRQTIFNGITPSGTSERMLLVCLNGVCETLEDTTPSDTELVREEGRYHLTWTKSSLIIRRSDILKEVMDAGRIVEEY